MGTTAYERVILERVNLNKDRLKLGQFMRSEKFDSLDELSKNLLSAQYHTMESYEFILEMRLNNWKD